MVQQANLEASFNIDSAGTHAHGGWPADERSAEVAKQKGYSLEGIIGRQVVKEDFDSFNYIFAMDEGHYRYLLQMKPHGSQGQVLLFLPFAFGEASSEKSVGDPYYGGQQGFVKVFEQIETGCERILQKIQDLHSLPSIAQNSVTH